MVNPALLSFSACLQATWPPLVTADPLGLEERKAIGSVLDERGTLTPLHCVSTASAVSQDSEARQAEHVYQGSAQKLRLLTEPP